MQSIKEYKDNLYEIKKSKFYSFAYPVFSIDEVSAILDDLRNRYKDATHICYAYILTNPQAEKMDDDGEPSGTAGKPMLELLKKKNIANILVVVIRYFGGIKLGAGGLIRAYTTASVEVVDKCRVITYARYKDVCLKIQHSELKDIRNYIDKEIDIYVGVIEYNQDVDIHLSILEESYTAITDRIISIIRRDSIIEEGYSIKVAKNQ